MPWQLLDARNTPQQQSPDDYFHKQQHRTPGIKFLEGMSGLIDLFKALFLPAFAALAVYVLFSFVIIPLVRKHRQRYAQYIPLDSLSAHTSSLRDRIASRLTAIVLPSFRRGDGLVDGSRSRSNSGSGDELAFGEEEGESMVGFSLNRRERGLGRGGTWTVVGGDRSHRDEIDSQRRLSRELEEGFKDDSEDESSGDDRSRR